MKVGDEYLELFVDEATGKVEWWTHVLRTIRGKWAYATVKNASTWGKVSKRHGDYGWKDPVHPLWRTKWLISSGRPDKLATTRLAALRYAISSHKRYSEPGDYPDPDMWAKALATLERMLTTEQNRRRKAMWKD